MKYERMIMEAESPDLIGPEKFLYNLAESSVRDRTLGELGIEFGNLSLPYGNHYGSPELRALIADQSGSNIAMDDVLVTAGAAGALFIISSSLLEPGDHMVVGFPNYATNYETPNAIGARVEEHVQTFEAGFSIDVDKLESQITDETRFVSLTCPHNPTGVMFSRQELDRLVDIVERKGCWLVVDETYREMAYGDPLPVAASLSDRVISVCSLSKTYGVPGIRVGWLVTRDQALMENFISAKEQIGITGSVLDETAAYQTLRQRDTLLPQIQDEIAEGFEVVSDWVSNEAMLEWVQPDAGVTCCVRVPGVSDAQMQRFYEIIKNRYKTALGPGYWFKLPDNYMRIGFGWTRPDDTRKGLQCISKALRDCFVN
ncbi:MAG: aminotransferase class I/II-fold pyridoxal phosphate-dependent enzyme [Woeseiaceae bacterium]